MKRFALLGLLIAVLGGGLYAYYQFGGSPEIKRERHLKVARQYLKESKLSEALIEFRNAVKADPTSAETRYEFAIALLKAGNPKAGYGELMRAVDLKPDFRKARYDLALFHLLTKDVASAKVHLEKLREQDRNAIETRQLAARIALFEKKPERALSELTELLKVNPDNVFVHIEIGLIHFSLKDYRLAEDSFRKALEIDSKNSGARVGLAELYSATGNMSKAEEELILASKGDPENETLLHLLGNLYSGTRKLDEFESLFLDLLKRKPESLMARKKLTEVYLLKGQNEKVKQLTDEILKSQPGDVDALYFRGRIRLVEKNLQGALEDFLTVTRGSTRFAPGFYFAGVVQARLNQIDDAKRNFVRAIELNPAWSQPREAVARLYVSRGDSDLALQQAERILERNPQNQNALLVAGAARLKKGDADKALASFKKALAANPKNVSARMNIAAVYTFQRKYPQAIEEYESVLKLDPDVVEALASVVQLNVLQGKRKAAFERAEQQLSKTKYPAIVYQLMGHVRIGNRQYSEGIKYLEKAIELDPNLASAYFLIGSAYAADQKFDTAIENYEKILKKNPKAVPALMMMGNLFDRKRQPQKANEYYQKVLDINKNSVAAANNLAWNYSEYGGNLDIALGLAQRARERSPDDPYLARTLGWIHYKKNAYLTAIGLLKESNEKFKGNNPEVLYNLGMAYLKNGDKALAAENLQKALQSGDNFNGREEATKALTAIAPK